MRTLGVWVRKLASAGQGGLIAAWAAILAITAGPLIGPVVYGADVNLHYFRLPVVESMWASGVPFSGWQPTLGHGYGYPLFSFYPPLSSYLYALVAQIPGVSAPIAFNATFALAIVVAVVAMGLACRQAFGGVAAVIGPALYVWSPVFLAQVYERSSLPNVWSLAFFALALWAGVQSRARAIWPWPIVAALALGAMLLSHLPSGLLLAGVWLGLMLAWTVRSWPVLALALGLACSAFIWVPAVADIGGTQYRAAVDAYLAAQGQLGFSPLWRWPETVISGLVNTGVPIRAGEVQVLLGAAALIVWGVNVRTCAPSHLRLIAMALGISGVSLFLASEASTSLWVNVDALTQTQIPARWLDAATPCLALAGAWVVQVVLGSGATEAGRLRMDRSRPIHRLPSIVRSRVATLLGVLTLACSFIVALAYLYPPRYTVGLPDRPSLAHARQAEERYGITGLTSWGEYWPLRFDPGPGTLPAVDALDPAARLVPNVRARVSVLIAGFNVTRLYIDAETATMLVFDIPWVAGWTAKVDGRPLTVGVDELGRIQLNVQPGESFVDLAFTGSPLQQSTQWISLAATLVACLALARGALRESSPGRTSAQGVEPGRSLGQAASEPGRAITDVDAWPSVRVLFTSLAVLLVVKIAVLDRVPTALVNAAPTGLVRPLSDAAAPVEVVRGLDLAGAELAPELVTVYWRVNSRIPRDYSFVITIVDGLGREVAQTQVAPTGQNLTSRWLPGQVIRQVVPLPNFPRQAPYAYQLALEAYDPLTGKPAGLGPVPVARLRAGPEPTRDRPLRALQSVVFGGVVGLEGVDFPSAVRVGEPFAYRLRWTSLATVSNDLTAFVHVVDSTGSLVAGQDRQPLDGRYPTSAWVPGDVIVDPREWQLDLPPGRYHLMAGLYDLASGERLPLLDGTTSQDLIAFDVVPR